MRRPARTLLAASTASLLVLGLGMGPLPSQSAHADEAFPAVNGQVTLVGRGYGHGRGMSQWGAYAAAQSGQTWQQIIGYYYPGARTGSLLRKTIRVSTAGLTGATMSVVPEAGLVADDGAGQVIRLATNDAGQPITGWQVALPGRGGTATTTTLWFTTASGRKALRSTTSGHWTIKAADGSITARNAAGRSVANYLGTFTGHRSGSSIVPVVATNLEDYTRQVVPWENVASWPVQAQAAQSVAARSYGAWHLSHPKSTLYDICDTTSCQVFKGIGNETSQTKQGVALTTGAVLVAKGAVTRSEFSASNGGQTAPTTVSYTTVKADPNELRLPTTVTTWRTTASVAAIQQRWPQVGRFSRLVVTGRDGHDQWGGRVTGLRVEGSAGSVAITVSQLGALTSSTLKSSWFTIASSQGLQHDVTGDGAGDLVALTSDGQVFASTSKGGTALAGAARIASGWKGYRAAFVGQFTSDRIADLMTVDHQGTLRVHAGRLNGLAAGEVVARGLTGYDRFTLAPGFNGSAAVLARRSADGALVAFAADGKGNLGTRPTVVSPSGWAGRSYTAMFAAGDVTGDGRADLVVRAGNGDLLAFPGTGTGRLGAAVRIGTGWQGFTSVGTAGDLNADGRSDLVARLASGETRVYLSRPGGYTGTRVAKGVGALLP